MVYLRLLSPRCNDGHFIRRMEVFADDRRMEQPSSMLGQLEKSSGECIDKGDGR